MSIVLYIFNLVILKTYNVYLIVMKKSAKSHAEGKCVAFLIFKKTRYYRVSILNGGSSGNRTSDTRIFSPLLYRLSYEANKKWRFRRELNPRSSAWQADVITTTPRNHGCGRWIWTNDLWVMSPASYRTAPSRDINSTNGGGKGIRTPAPLARPPGFQDRSLQPDLGIPP